MMYVADEMRQKQANVMLAKMMGSRVKSFPE